MHHFIIIITLYLSALVAGGGIISKPNQPPSDEGIQMTDMSLSSSGHISKTNDIAKGGALHGECRYLKVHITLPDGTAKSSAKDTTKGTARGPTTISTPYRQVLLTADCRRPMSDPKKALPDGDWRETKLDVDKCVGWNPQTQKLTPESDGKGLMKGDCWSCDYFTGVMGATHKGDFECYCDNVEKNSKHKIPHSTEKSLKVKFALDSVLWSKDGYLNCHEHIGS